MILNVKEVELLKLLCWCKNAPAPSAWQIGIFNAQSIAALEHFGLVFVSRNKKYIRPRPSAYHLMETAGFSFKADAAPQTRPRILDRRNIAAKVLLTFYSAGADVFKDTIDEISEKAVYVPSFAARSANSGNPFGSTKFYGIYQTSETLFLVFHADDAGVYFQKELTLFHSYIDRSPIQKTGLIFMGGSTSEIGNTIFHAHSPTEQAKKKYNTDSFGKVFSATSLPVHFVPIGREGAQMLRYIAMPQYRERMAKLILRRSYQPPYDGLPDTDAVHYQPPHLPAAITLDMDIKRIDRAIIAAKEQGFPKIVLYALPEQMSFLREHYKGQADVIMVNTAGLEKELGAMRDGQEKTAPYFTKEGRCIDVADFAVCRKNKA